MVKSTGSAVSPRMLHLVASLFSQRACGLHTPSFVTMVLPLAGKGELLFYTGRIRCQG